jgi:hypothetical protein
MRLSFTGGWGDAGAEIRSHIAIHMRNLLRACLILSRSDSPAYSRDTNRASECLLWICDRESFICDRKSFPWVAPSPRNLLLADYSSDRTLEKLFGSVLWLACCPVKSASKVHLKLLDGVVRGRLLFDRHMEIVNCSDSENHVVLTWQWSWERNVEARRSQR